jgi:hypothetical protein
MVALPFGTIAQVLGVAVAAFGITGLIYFAGAIRRGKVSALAFGQRYAILARHGEKLGLQALIGDDLRSLVVGWVPSVIAPSEEHDGREVPQHAFSAQSLYWSSPLLALFGTFWLISILRPGVYFAEWSTLSSICEKLFSPDWCSQSQPNFAAQLFVFGIWASACAGALWLVHAQQSSEQKILLVIDDLDRCPPGDMLELIEALKLLLEDERINQRVQVLMLIDEDLLDHAIVGKFRELTVERSNDETNPRSKWARQDIVWEHKEKLFACHLRLPGLDAKLISDLAVKYAETASVKLRKDPAVLEPFSSVMEGMVSKVSGRGAKVGPLGIERNTREKPAEPTEPAAQIRFGANDLRFNDREIALFRESLARYMHSGARRPSPRAIRLFLFKYQLCRSLMQMSRNEDARALLSSDRAAGVILRALAAACFGNAESVEDGDEVSETLRLAVAQSA